MNISNIIFFVLKIDLLFFYLNFLSIRGEFLAHKTNLFPLLFYIFKLNCIKPG
jgi:hypothetical protein